MLPGVNIRARGYVTGGEYNGSGWFVETLATNVMSVSASPPDGGTVSGGGSYSAGAGVTVRANPATNYAFSTWTESGFPVSASTNYSFPAETSRTLVANFTSNIPTYALRTNQFLVSESDGVVNIVIEKSQPGAPER